MTELNRTHLDQLENPAGEIRDFTGIDAPYEAPKNPEIVVRTDQQTADESVTTVLEQLLLRLREYEANE